MSDSTTNLLSPDLLGMVSTFLDLCNVSSLLVTVGGVKARAIKKSYLHRNFRYIENCVLTETKATKRYTLLFSNGLISDWMDANGSGWKDIYRRRNDLSKADALVFDNYFSCIHGAVQLGSIEVVAHLIEHRGADPNFEASVTHQSGTALFRPLVVAALDPSIRCLSYLLSRDDVERNFVVNPQSGHTFGHAVVIFATVKALEICLQSGVDANAQNTLNGRTALHTVCCMTVAPLRQEGEILRQNQLNFRFRSDLNAYSHGTTQAHHSAMNVVCCTSTCNAPHGPSEVQGDQILRRMRLLLEHGADPRIVDHTGRTPRDVLELFRKRPHQWRPNVTDELFANLIAMLEEHERYAARQEANL